jgi:uncharacterized protein (UPF0332 family)
VTQEQITLIRHRMDRARESLEEARLLLEAGRFNGSVNRLYYACFYAVSALLLTQGQSSSKHSGVRALFDREWVNSGKVPREVGRFYRKLFNSRQQGDYSDLAEFQETEVHAWFAQANHLIEVLARQVEEILRASAAGETGDP